MSPFQRNKYVQIEEIINCLYRSPEIKRRRSQAADWVRGRLQQQAEAAFLPPLGVSEAEWRQCREGDGAERGEMLDKIVEALRTQPPSSGQEDLLTLSGRKMRELEALAAASPAGAVQWLTDYLTERERISFCKKAGISPATWKRFAECTVYTSEQNISRIVQTLGLNEEDAAAFQALVIRELFYDLSRLRPELMRRIKEADLTITEFLSRAFISEKAWKPFSGGREDRPASQGTLLKIIICLAMTPDDGKAFLALVNSGFVMRRDLVVLACMCCGIYDVYELSDILETFSQGYGGEKLYGNLYSNLE